MKKEEIDLMMSKFDKRLKFPKNWNEFVERQSFKHNILIKDKIEKNYYCTHCKKTFKDKKYNVGDYEKCPICNNSFRVYSSKTYYNQEFTNSVILVQRVNYQIIIRVFEIYSFFNENIKKIDRSIVEYARIIPGIGYFLSNAVYFDYYKNMFISHYHKELEWYEYKGTRDFTNFTTYPYSIKKLTKGTNLEYAPMAEFKNYFLNYGYNDLNILYLAGFKSFEFLWNLKLYNLSRFSYRFKKSGSFFDVFGLPKDYLKFMQENNIDIYRYNVLKVVKKKDINFINECNKRNYNYLRYFYKRGALKEFLDLKHFYFDRDDFKLLNEISEYVPLKKFLKYEQGYRHLYIYRDYLKMRKELGYTQKGKDYLYPENLLDIHDELQKKIKIIDDFHSQCKVYIRYLELSKYTFEDNKYIIFPAPSIDAIKDEGEQQDNCVATNYLKDYMNSETEIFFIRELNNMKKSFITLEYKNGHVIQKELPYHSKNFSIEHLDFINKWCQFRKFMDQKEKYQNNKIAIKKYTIDEKVA